MDTVVREATPDAAVVEALLERGSTAAKPAESDRDLCLIPEVLVRFLQVTPPLQWKAYRVTKGADAGGLLCRRVRDVMPTTGNVSRPGWLDILRRGFKMAAATGSER